MIGEGELEPGARVPEKLLCMCFGVSRTPLREALKVLSRRSRNACARRARRSPPARPRLETREEANGGDDGGRSGGGDPGRLADLCRLGQGVPRAHRGARTFHRRLGLSRPSLCARPGRGGRPSTRGGRPSRPATWRAGGNQGHIRHCGYAHRERHGPPRRPDAGRGLRRRGPAAAGGGGRHGQDGDDGTGRLCTGQDAQPSGAGASPGGSSSGSAAAIAAGMAPLAIGSQTNGSIIRPASYCGVVGYKPTRGLIFRYGGLSQSRFLDTVGVLAANVGDAALIADVLMVFYGRDPGQQMRARPTLVETAAADFPVAPRLAFVRTHLWDRLDADAAKAFENLADRFPGIVAEVVLPDWTAKGLDWHRTILEADLARSFTAEYEQGRDRRAPYCAR